MKGQVGWRCASSTSFLFFFALWFWVCESKMGLKFPNCDGKIQREKGEMKNREGEMKNREGGKEWRE